MRIALMGATGYGGTEAMRLLRGRPDLALAWVGSDRLAGQTVAEVLPQFMGSTIGALRFSPLKEVTEMQDIDLMLLALPHGEARVVAPKLIAQGIRVIDFSGDYRLPQELYATWYGAPAQQVDGVEGAVYGLPELYREEIKTARLVANPGCYATCAALALLPLVEAGVVDCGRLVVDAKSGVSGAGKTPSQGTHFVEVQESLRAYKVGAHQHTPEIEQTLTLGRRRRDLGAADEPVKVLLTTQLLPIRRGIYVTAYAPLLEALTTRDLHALYEERYREEPFVQVLPPGQVPEIRHTTGTNLCQIAVHADERTGLALVLATIDNLGKGAAGQAIQNLNIMLGLAETEGLSDGPFL